MEKKKSGNIGSENWGGRREGSGRKKGDKVYKTVSVAGTEEELLQLKNIAKENNKTLSRYVIDSLVYKK